MKILLSETQKFQEAPETIEHTIISIGSSSVPSSWASAMIYMI